MINNETLNKIKQIGLRADWQLAFSGTAKGNYHLFRMVKIAKYLAQHYQADIRLVEAAAWLHDIPLIMGEDLDFDKNKSETIKILAHLNLSNQEIRAIAECAAGHEGTIKLKNLEAKIVHDADVLEKTGLLGVIRHTWKLVNQNKISRKNNISLAKNVLDHIKWRQKRLQTPLAKKLAINLNKNFDIKKVHTIVLKIEPLVKKGLTTEKIAKILIKDLEAKDKQKLNSQLNVFYLP